MAGTTAGDNSLKEMDASMTATQTELIEDYRDKMIKIAVAMLDKETLDALMYGDPFDKLLRNISTRGVNGELFYNNSLTLEHYPRSENADNLARKYKTWAHMKAKWVASAKNTSEREPTLLLYLEHDVPISVTKKMLIEESKKDDVDSEKLERIITEGCAVTLITKADANEINEKHNSSMPEGITRYEAAGIRIIPPRHVKIKTGTIRTEKGLAKMPTPQ